MARPQSRFICQRCAESFARWEGQCRACGEWNSLVETIVREPSRAARPGPAGTLPRKPPDSPTSRKPISLAAASASASSTACSVAAWSPVRSFSWAGSPASESRRCCSRRRPAWRVGLPAPPASCTPRARSPRARSGSGPLAWAFSAACGADRIEVLAEHDVGRIVEVARATRPALVVVDSIQTATVEELDGAAGSVGQVRECALRLMDLAKGEGIAVILVGHVTKDGSIAGPKTLEHLVDAVVSLEGERHAAMRLLRATKNRFGSTDEIGVFEMNETGLMEVADPARAFLAVHQGSAPGSIVAPTMDGSRPILVEVQALVSPTGYGTPTRKASGLDPNRVSLLIAVLGRRAGVALGSHDVYTNLAGGLSVMEPGLDLPVALALASSLRDRPIAPGTVAIGEVGLLGELRGVIGLERRLREAGRLGFHRAIVPRPSAAATAPRVEGLDVVYADTLAEAIKAALDDRAEARARAVPAMLG